jgi:hypothetical protein
MTSRLVRIILGFVLAPLLAGAVSAAPALAAKSGSWAATGSMNAARMAATVTALPNGQVLAAGGANYNWTPLASAELYNPATGTWTATGSLHTARYGHAAALLQNGEAMVIGGENAIGYTPTAELYNPATGTWSATGSMLVACYGFPATTLQMAWRSSPAATRQQEACSPRQRCTPLPPASGRPPAGWTGPGPCSR